LRIRRSPPVLISGTHYPLIPIPGCERGISLCASRRELSTTVSHPGPGPMDPAVLTLTLTDRLSLLHFLQRSDGLRMEDHFAQHDLHIGDIRALVPSSIRSLLSFFRERRSNSAQQDPPLFTPLGEEGPLCASLPLLISEWSPGPRR